MILRRETRFASDGTYTFRDELRITGTVTATVLTGAAWLLEHFEIASGTVSFLSGNDRVLPPRRPFYVFYPPFSISRISLDGLCGAVRGKAGADPLPDRFNGTPFAFVAEAATGEQSVAATLEHASQIQFVDVNPRASSLSVKARKLIGQLRISDPSIARISARLGVSNAHLSRQFRRDYGMSPRQYLHQVRIADVPLRLARGESIAEVSSSAGYGDLSRFYKQFQKATDASPGRCRKLLVATRPRAAAIEIKKRQDVFARDR